MPGPAYHGKRHRRAAKQQSDDRTNERTPQPARNRAVFINMSRLGSDLHPLRRVTATTCEHKARSAKTSIRVAFPNFSRSIPAMMKSARFLACPPFGMRTSSERNTTLSPSRPAPRRAAELRLHRAAAFFPHPIRRPFRKRLIDGSGNEARTAMGDRGHAERGARNMSPVGRAR